MILVDFNAIAIGNVVMSKIEIEENMIRHMILNTLRMYNKKYRKEYGNMVLCCDAGGSWRKEYFKEYKFSRKAHRDESGIDWSEAYRIINMVREEIEDNLPWKVVKVVGCEGDDIIATLVENTQEFGQYEDIMIVSADKDFAQLQKYKNVNQFSTITKKLIKEKNPRQYLFEHTCRGDGSDGVPNVLSPDNQFVDVEGRMPALYKKRIDAWEKSKDLKGDMGEEIYRNFQRNQMMIDLSRIPDDQVKQINDAYDAQASIANSKTLPYLMAKRCRSLMECAADFF